MSRDEEIRLMTTIGTLSETVALLNQAIRGNGVKGMGDRVTEIEKWKSEHPLVCPMVKKKGEILIARGLEVSVIAVVVTVLELILRGLKIL